MTDLIVVSLEPWDDVWRRNQHLISGLLRRDPTLRVLFVEPPDDPLHNIRSGTRPRFGQRVRRHPTVSQLWTYRPTKWLPRRFDSGADERMARGMLAVARTLGMHHPILWINDPAATAIVRATGWPTLYDITDDWVVASRNDGEHERVTRGEDFLLATARAVTACSTEIIRRKRPQRGDITLVPNAVDVSAYLAPTTRPADLPPGLVALYVGTLHTDRLDIDLCERTARTLHGIGTLVFVGPNLLPSAATDELTASGAVVLGARESGVVPAYLQHADLLIVPHVVTDFTDSLDPIKLYEYQAVGRPVVATPVAGFRTGAQVTCAPSSDFPSAVTRLIDAVEPFPHGADALTADWSVRVRAMADVLSHITGIEADRA